jgi:hypothetical protein
MRRGACLAACFALGGCSGLTEEGGVAGLEVAIPRPAEVEVGQTITLVARALDAAGNPVDVPVTWLTPDTTLVVGQNGDVTGRTGGSTGRVQAQAGTLASDLVTFTILPRPDTLVLSADSVLTVAPDVQLSGPMVATLRSFAPPEPLAGRTIVYTVTSPGFTDPADRTVELVGGVLTLGAETGSDGAPATPVTLARIAGRPAPAAAIVTVSAVTATGLPVPGSGQRFRVQFQ